MGNKFEVGDRVRCLDSNIPGVFDIGHLEKGSVYEAQYVAKSGFLKVEGGGDYWYDPDQFEAVEKEFEPGDLVRIDPDNACPARVPNEEYPDNEGVIEEVGPVGTVHQVESFVKLRCGDGWWFENEKLELVEPKSEPKSEPEPEFDYDPLKVAEFVRDNIDNAAPAPGPDCSVDPQVSVGDDFTIQEINDRSAWIWFEISGQMFFIESDPREISNTIDRADAEKFVRGEFGPLTIVFDDGSVAKVTGEGLEIG